MTALLHRGSRVPKAPAASILIPVLDRVEHLIACLRSLEALRVPAFETVVIANGTPEEALAGLPNPESLVLVRSPVNLGFGGGCNWGARAARGREHVRRLRFRQGCRASA